MNIQPPPDKVKLKNKVFVLREPDASIIARRPPFLRLPAELHTMIYEFALIEPTR
ncbi:hypothetical protein K402DRAFT_423734 [Aulographum hederae CBS 113979]|uniref:Uncharacterized protein n=1 Tax=Aulographum hederae CBS 113979 TaxID=1176131 RepID=A0A6G1GQZ2_9PEZI|nr:hypothetical protein K402DRAFT_423734 [Aulographum hederae CBS 113979]